MSPSANSIVVPPVDRFALHRCHRAAHYSCLDPTGEHFEELALAYFRDGNCHDCFRYVNPLDVILAWAEDESLPELTKEAVDEDDVVEEVPEMKRQDPETGKVYTIPSAKDPSARAKVSMPPAAPCAAGC